MSNWDSRMLGLAEHVAGWSKDPSTHTGCIIARPDRTVASMGYNGLPRGVDDLPERLADRPTKYAMTVHAEANAIIAAREPVHGCTAYVWPWQPCAPCAAMLIQAGVVRIVAPSPTTAQIERWGESFKHSAVMLLEAGVALDLRPSRRGWHEGSAPMASTESAPCSSFKAAAIPDSRSEGTTCHE